MTNKEHLNNKLVETAKEMTDEHLETSLKHYSDLLEATSKNFLEDETLKMILEILQNEKENRTEVK